MRDTYSTTLAEAAEHERLYGDSDDGYDAADEELDEELDEDECGCSDPECPCSGAKGYWRKP